MFNLRKGKDKHLSDGHMVIAKITKVCENANGLLGFESKPEIPVVAMSIVRHGCPL